jgi:hypothetical protein
VAQLVKNIASTLKYTVHLLFAFANNSLSGQGTFSYNLDCLRKEKLKETK